MDLTLEQIKKELEKLETLEEKKAYLEEVLKKIKPELKKDVEKLLEEVLEQLEKEKELFPVEKLEQKLVETPIIEEIKVEELAEATKAEENIKKYAGEESKLEREVGLAIPLKPKEEQKYVRPEEAIIPYHTAKHTIENLRDYFTKVLRIDLKSVQYNPQLKKEMEEHISKVFSLGDKWSDRKRLENYFSWTIKPEEEKKYKTLI